MVEDAELTAALRDLDKSTRADLVQRWRRLYRSTPPRYAGPQFLARAIAYALQERALSGLSVATRRRLTAIANGAATLPAAQSAKIKPGTRLLRQWHGATHEVIVTDKGLFRNGQSYRSLSAVAFAITGAKWNGRLFFGMVDKRRRSNG